MTADAGCTGAAVWTPAFAGVTRRNLSRPPPATTVAAVDVERVDYISKMLAAAGVERRRAFERAAFLYWAYLGQAILTYPRHSSVAPSAMDDIADLFER